MEKLTLVEVAPRWEGDAAAVLGWPDESWDEYATACVEHVDLHPAGQRPIRPSDVNRRWDGHANGTSDLEGSGLELP